jgi:acyl-coenzyme A synthetase/AMP-(fatty) acid ligase
MKNTITRHCINPEILLHEHDPATGELIKIYNYNEFCYLIDRWKIILIEKYNAKPGQTIFLYAGPNLQYYSLFFAAAELGLVFIIDWPHCWTESDLDNPKVTMYGKIDYIFLLKLQHDLDNPKCNISSWEKERNLRFVNTMLYEEEFYDYDIGNSNLISKVADIIWATPDSPLLYSTSSGTTGAPKKIINSHKKVYLMAARLAEHYFKNNDSALHTNTMHHGASLCYHFLPAFMKGKEQFTLELGVDYRNQITGANSVKNDTLINFVIDNKINQLLLFVPASVSSFLANVPRVEHPINIITLYQITTEMLSLMKEKNINSINSPFGDTTIGLGFFIKTVDQNTNMVNYDVTNMGPVLDEFFQVELRDGSLYISCPELNEDWKTSDDVFEIIDGNYHFRGRANTYRINGEWIKLSQLEQAVAQCFGTGANIVVDSEQQKIYLAIWKSDPPAEKTLHEFFTENYSQVNISYVLRNAEYVHFFNGRKIDNSKVRQVCREKILKEGVK